MKNWFIFLLVLSSVGAVSAQSTRAVYVHPDFASLAKPDDQLAVVPFTVDMILRPQEVEQLGTDKIKEMERKAGLDAQEAMIAWILRNYNTKNGSRLKFLDATTTNAMLRKAGLDPQALGDRTPEELAGILGVDGLISGTLNLTKPMSEGAAIALYVGVGSWGPTNSGNASISLNDKRNTLWWKYDKQLARGLGSDINSIMDSLMRKASKTFPYRKMK